MKRSILFSAFVSLAVAQQDHGYRGDDGGWRQDYNTGGQYNNDNHNMYADYVAKKGTDGRRGGWGKLLLAGVGGYVLGAKIHTTRLKKSIPTLRFKLKQRVTCNVGTSQWVKGTIVKLWSSQSEGEWMPYEILLDNGEKVFAPIDNASVIRAVS
eukprot:746958_1